MSREGPGADTVTYSITSLARASSVAATSDRRQTKTPTAMGRSSGGNQSGQSRRYDLNPFTGIRDGNPFTGIRDGAAHDNQGIEHKPRHRAA